VEVRVTVELMRPSSPYTPVLITLVVEIGEGSPDVPIGPHRMMLLLLLMVREVVRLVVSGMMPRVNDDPS